MDIPEKFRIRMKNPKQSQATSLQLVAFQADFGWSPDGDQTVKYLTCYGLVFSSDLTMYQHTDKHSWDMKNITEVSYADALKFFAQIIEKRETESNLSPPDRTLKELENRFAHARVNHDSIIGIDWYMESLIRHVRIIKQDVEKLKNSKVAIRDSLKNP